MGFTSAWKKWKSLGEPKRAEILLNNAAMLVLVLLIEFVLPAHGSVVPWYPYLLPIHAPTYRHHHTTHIVPKPIVHTRVVVLDDVLSQLHPRHQGNSLLLQNILQQQHGNQHLHQHDNQHLHQYSNLRQQLDKLLRQRVKPTTQGRSNAVVFPKTDNKKAESVHLYPEDYRHFKYGHRGKHHHTKPKTKYSVPASESPWKPLKHVPNYGFVPLKYLDVHGDVGSKVVKDAMNEIDVEHYPQLRFPTRIQNIIEPQMKPLPAMYRGTVLYDDDHTSRSRQLHDSPVYVTNNHFQKYASKKSSFNPSMECQCQGPFSNRDFS